MCTVSWRTSKDGYDVFFNRDEQITRPRADLPKVFRENNTRIIMPVDPQGGGTWLAVNEHGLTFALLNYYQGRLPKGRLISRGQIVRACAGFSSVASATAYVEQLNLAKHAPFSLLCFSKDQRETAGVTLLRWTGKQLEYTEQRCPLISSAIRYGEVYESRINVYRDVMGEVCGSENATAVEPEAMIAQHYALHSSHFPERSAESICMHRDDAQTVSFSHVHVGSEQIEYFYSDGAPCETAIEKVAEMPMVIA